MLKTRITAAVAVAIIALGGLTAGCSKADDTTTTQAATTTSQAATTTMATTTTMPATTTTVSATTVAEGESLPTYSEVVATYPAGTELCTTQGGISGDEAGYSLGDFDGQSATIEFRDGEMLSWCLGAKYVVTGPMVDEDGQPIAVGVLLTLDADSQFVQVSSFD